MVTSVLACLRPVRINRANLIILFACAVAAGCGGSNGTSAAGAGAEGGRGGGRGGRGAGAGGAVPVVTAPVVSRSVPLTIDAVGTGEAFTTVQIRSQVTGQLSAVHFAEGQDVHKGQLLFALDRRPFEAALQQAEAILAKDTAQAKNAQSQAARYEDLFKRGLIPRDQYETQTSGAAALQATLNADRAAVEEARLNVQYTEITSPIDGRTGALMAHAGDLIRANDQNALVVINQVSPIRVLFSVPGRVLPEIRRYQARTGLHVEARTPAAAPSGAQPPPVAPAADRDEPGQAETAPAAEGTVTFIDNSVDPSTGTIKMKATFPNTDHRLWPGSFVQVRLLLTTEANAITVPSAAVQTTQDGQYVYVVKPDQTVEFRQVSVGRQQGPEAVIARGLLPGEIVVTDGQLRLTPGAHVTTHQPGSQEGGEGRGRTPRPKVTS